MTIKQGALGAMLPSQMINHPYGNQRREQETPAKSPWEVCSVQMLSSLAMENTAEVLPSREIDHFPFWGLIFPSSLPWLYLIILSSPHCSEEEAFKILSSVFVSLGGLVLKTKPSVSGNSWSFKIPLLPAHPAYSTSLDKCHQLCS